MARTRAQDDRDSNGQASPKPERPSEGSGVKGHRKMSARNQKRQREDGDGDKVTVNRHRLVDEQSPVPKKARPAESPRGGGKREVTGVDKAKLNTMMEAYGVLPLSDSGLVDARKPTRETMLALVYMAMLTSARISHELAYKSVKCLLEAGYHDIDMLQKSTWQERTEVLTKGGYTRYREKTATALGELADFVKNVYDGDLNNLLKRAESSPAKIRSLLQEIKGIGKVGTNIFCNVAQAAWPCLAPFIDPRSMQTAEHCGLGSDVGSMWHAVDKDPVEMCKLSSALTMVRLDKKESDFN